MKKKSLDEINGSVNVPTVYESAFWQKFLAYSGPGALVAVGYMDPGNWITSVVGGATYRYLLLSAVLVSSVMAMQLQQMAGKLGIVTRMDLAEVIGAGIALHLLFGWSLLFSILITVFDVFLLLFLMKLGFRKIEAIVGTLILTILLIFLYLVILAKPDLHHILSGYLPNLAAYQHTASKNGTSVLTLALGIVGATVMPHNLYLHSSIAQTRKVNYRAKQSVHEAVRFMTWDSNIQLSLAFVVNSLLLILGAALFFGHADKIGAFSAMYNALKDPQIAGAIASPILSTLFAVALLASGQNSTITGTLTGQIVMEGFLNMKLPPWFLRLVTRLLALLPVVIVAILYGDKEQVLDNLLVYSQVFLSVALPFSIFPLVYFTSNKKLMGEFVNSKWNTYLAYSVSILLTILNVKLVVDLF